MVDLPTVEAHQLREERRELLERLDRWLDRPMLVLAFAWLALFVVETIWGVSPVLEVLGYVIWALFAFDFALGLVVAPVKRAYLRENWLKAIGLAVPALRVFRIVGMVRLTRTARAARGLRLLRVVSALNRGMRAFGASMRRRGFGYVVGSTMLVTLLGAAGMYAFENTPGRDGLTSYGEALWWTAMVMLTMGSNYWPQTAEGCVLCLVLALNAFGVFGYVAATLATFFIGRDADNDDAELAGARALEALRAEVIDLRQEVRAMTRKSTAGRESG